MNTLLDRLASALQVLVDKYIANSGTDYEGVTCITPEGIPEYWSNAQALLREYEEYRAKNDMPQALQATIRAALLSASQCLKYVNYVGGVPGSAVRAEALQLLEEATALLQETKFPRIFPGYTVRLRGEYDHYVLVEATVSARGEGVDTFYGAGGLHMQSDITEVVSPTGKVLWCKGCATALDKKEQDAHQS